jgi:multiple antibiotic resistance protein
MDWMALLVASIQIFAITDPIGNLPIFYGITKKLTHKERQKTFMTAVFFAFSLLILFAFLGNGILELFRITMADFKVAGGILILIISILILVRGSWVEDSEHPETVGAVPIGCPLLVGPGAITTAMVSMGINGIKITLLAIAVNFIVSFITLFFGEKIFKFLGETGSEIIGKVMAILLAAIAVSFIHSGIFQWITEFNQVTIK